MIVLSLGTDLSVRLLYGSVESRFDSLWIAANSLCERGHFWAFGLRVKKFEAFLD